jgi:hypothetical protein
MPQKRSRRFSSISGFQGFSRNSNQKQWQSFIQKENIIERSKMREETCLPAGRDEKRRKQQQKDQKIRFQQGLS